MGNSYYSVCDVFELYDNNVSPRLIMIIIDIIILYLKHVLHTDYFPLNGYPTSVLLKIMTTAMELPR